MSRDCCVALPHSAMGLSAVFVIVVFPDHTRLLFLSCGLKDLDISILNSLKSTAN